MPPCSYRNRCRQKLISNITACNVAPVFLDTAKTVQKTVILIQEAANNRADLVVFPETYIPAFPLWVRACHLPIDGVHNFDHILMWRRQLSQHRSIITTSSLILLARVSSLMARRSRRYNRPAYRIMSLLISVSTNDPATVSVACGIPQYSLVTKAKF